MEDLSELKEIIHNLENSERTPEVIEWAKTVWQKDFGLVESMIKTFMDNMEKYDLSNSILRALRKLGEYVPDLIMPQMKDDPLFPKAITQYITRTNIKNLEGDGFLLLVRLFDSSSFKDVSKDAFVRALFDDLEYIKEENVFNSIVAILIAIANEAPKASESMVVKLCATHPSRRYVGESILHLINKGDDKSKIRSLKTLKDIYESWPNPDECFLYSNDLKELINILYREIANTSSNDMKILYMKTLEFVSKSAEYKKEKHRGADLMELMQEIQYGDFPPAVRDEADKLVKSGNF